MKISEMTSMNIKNSHFLFCVAILGFLALMSFSPESKLGEKHEIIAIQIFALKDSIPIHVIQHEYQIDTPVYIRFQDGMFKYWIGPYDDFRSADKYLLRIKSISKLKEAFVVKFRHDDFFKINSKIDSVLNQPVKDNQVVASLDSYKTEKPIEILDTGFIDSGITSKNYEPGIVGDSFKQRVLHYRSQHAIWVIVSYFLLLSFFTLAFVFYSRFYSQWLTKKRNFYIDRIQSGLADYLFNHEINTIPTQLLMIKKRSKRQLLIDEIVKLKTNLSGEVLVLLNDLYRNLGLTDESFAKLKKSRWDLKVKGFKELSTMEIKEAIPKIEKFTSHRNSELRNEAFLALVKLREEDPLGFLDSENVFLTSWDQLNLHASIQNSNLEIPEFKRWLGTSNESVILFALRMVTIHKQFEAAPEIVALLKHSDENIRKHAIQSVGYMELSAFSGELSQIYKNETYKNQLEIIHSIGMIGNEQEFGLLSEIINTESDHDLLFAGMKALSMMGKNGKNLIVEVVGRRHELTDIAKHVSDKRI